MIATDDYVHYYFADYKKKHSSLISEWDDNISDTKQSLFTEYVKNKRENFTVSSSILEQTDDVINLMDGLTSFFADVNNDAEIVQAFNEAIEDTQEKFTISDYDNNKNSFYSILQTKIDKLSSAVNKFNIDTQTVDDTLKKFVNDNQTIDAFKRIIFTELSNSGIGNIFDKDNNIVLNSETKQKIMSILVDTDGFKSINLPTLSEASKTISTNFARILVLDELLKDGNWTFLNQEYYVTHGRDTKNSDGTRNGRNASGREFLKALLAKINGWKSNIAGGSGEIAALASMQMALQQQDAILKNINELNKNNSTSKDNFSMIINTNNNGESGGCKFLIEGRVTGEDTNKDTSGKSHVSKGDNNIKIYQISDGEMKLVVDFGVNVKNYSSKSNNGAMPKSIRIVSGMNFIEAYEKLQKPKSLLYNVMAGHPNKKIKDDDISVLWKNLKDGISIVNFITALAGIETEDGSGRVVYASINGHVYTIEKIIDMVSNIFDSRQGKPMGFFGQTNITRKAIVEQNEWKKLEENGDKQALANERSDSVISAISKAKFSITLNSLSNLVK
jgi:hypothetical protein